MTVRKLGDRPCDCAGNLHNIRLLFENNATFQNGHFGDRPSQWSVVRCQWSWSVGEWGREGVGELEN